MNTTRIAGIAGITITITADNTSNALVADGSLPMSADVGGQTGAGIVAILITCETYQVRFTHGVAVTNSTGHILFVNQSLLIENPASIRSFRYINDTDGENGVLRVTPYYGRLSAK